MPVVRKPASTETAVQWLQQEGWTQSFARTRGRPMRTAEMLGRTGGEVKITADVSMRPECAGVAGERCPYLNGSSVDVPLDSHLPMHTRHLSIPAAALAVALAAAPALFAQRTLATADYDRAAKMLSFNVDPLVVGERVFADWLPGDRFYYRNTTLQGSEWLLVDPARKSRRPLFDAAAMAQALERAGAGTFKASDIPAERAELSSDGKTGSATWRDTPARRTPRPSDPHPHASAAAARRKLRRPTGSASRSSATGISGCATPPADRKRSSPQTAPRISATPRTTPGGRTAIVPSSSARPIRRRSPRSSRTSGMWATCTSWKAASATPFCTRGSTHCPATA